MQDIPYRIESLPATIVLGVGRTPQPTGDLVTGQLGVKHCVYVGEPGLQFLIHKLLTVLQPQQLGDLCQRHHSQQILAVVIGIHLPVLPSLSVYPLGGLAQKMLVVGPHFQFVGSVQNVDCGR